MELMSEERLDMYLDHLRVERGLATNTISAYALDIRRFLDYLSDQRISGPEAAERSHFMSYMLHLSRSGLGARSRARTLSALKNFYLFLGKEGYISSNPVADFDPPKSMAHLPQTLSPKEVEALLASPDTGSPSGLRDKALLELMYATGLRVSECVNLQTAHVNLEAGYLRTMGKGSKERLVPMGDIAQNWIKRYLSESRPLLLKNRSCPILFLNRRGTGLSRQYIWRKIKELSLIHI